MDDVLSTMPPARRRTPLRSARLWMALGAVLIAVVALLDVTITGPRVTVRWRAEISPADRAARERRYQLQHGEPDQGTSWRYELGDRSRDNIRALVHDPAVDDTGYIDRDAFAAENQQVRATVRPLPFPFSADDEGFTNPWQLFQLQSPVAPAGRRSSAVGSARVRCWPRRRCCISAGSRPAITRSMWRSSRCLHVDCATAAGASRPAAR